MRKPNGTVEDVLIRRKLIDSGQVNDARNLCNRTGGTLHDALIRLAYVTPWEVTCALGELYGLAVVDLTDVTIPASVIELVPESVARENVVLPLAQEKGILTTVMACPDPETMQKLQFILSKNIEIVLAPRDQILAAIDLHYGHCNQEAVDSMIAEFTDTAIDFCESESVAWPDEQKDVFETDFDLPSLEEHSASEVVALDESVNNLESSEFELALEDSGVDELFEEDLLSSASGESSVEQAPHRKSRGCRTPLVNRQATIRYYHRMNPERMFPMLVVISKQAIEKVVKKHVSQTQSKKFQVALDSLVEVEPILPGCSCYPPKDVLLIRQGEVSAKFHVVPHVLGTILHARVVIRQEGRVLAEVPLELCVVKQALTLFMGAMSVVCPLVSMMVKHLNIDFKAQLAEQADLYALAADWFFSSVTPETIAGTLLLATGIMYFWLRPRQRDVFWDIHPVDKDGNNAGDEDPGQATATAAEAAEAILTQYRRGGPTMLATRKPPVRADARQTRSTDKPVSSAKSNSQRACIARADFEFEARDYPAALNLYERCLAMGKVGPRVYHRASLAAGMLGDNWRALKILKQAQRQLRQSEMKGGMWFNLGCFATRLGWFQDAMCYLCQAIDAGYRNAEKYRKDPDLEPLRSQSDFKRLLRSLSEMSNP